MMRRAITTAFQYSTKKIGLHQRQASALTTTATAEEKAGAGATATAEEKAGAKLSLTRKITEAVQKLQTQHTAYDPSKLQHTLTQHIPAYSFRNRLTYHPATQHHGLTTYPVLLQQPPLWAGKSTTLFVNTREFERGSVKAPFMAQEVQSNSASNMPNANWVMLRYVLNNDACQFEDRDTAQRIKQEYQWNQRLGRTHPNFPPQRCRYHIYDSHSQKIEERRICTYPVKYAGPDLVALFDTLMLGPLEQRWLFICCYHKLFQAVEELHSTYQLEHRDIKADNMTLTLAPEEEYGVTGNLFDFGLSRRTDQIQNSNKYDDIPSCARLLRAVHDVCHSDYKPGEQQANRQHLSELEASPPGSTISDWRHLLWSKPRLQQFLPPERCAPTTTAQDHPDPTIQTTPQQLSA